MTTKRLDTARSLLQFKQIISLIGVTRQTVIGIEQSRYRFTLKDAPFLAIAGLWREGAGNQPASFTMLTTEPGEDVASYHNRQIVILRPDQWSAWIDLSRSEAELLRPLPAGSLSVETVRVGKE